MRATNTSALSLKPASYRWIKSRMKMKKFGLKTQGLDQRAGADKLQTRGGSSLAISKVTRNWKTKVEPITNAKVYIKSLPWANWYNQESSSSNSPNLTARNWTIKIDMLRNRRRKASALRKVAVFPSIRISHLASANNTKSVPIATQFWRLG